MIFNRPVHSWITLTMAIVASVCVPKTLSAQPTWNVDVADYAYNGDITGVVYVNGALVSEGVLGAFVNDTCRGFTDSPLYFGPSGLDLFQFLVYSNSTSQDTLSFRYYDPVTDSVYVAIETIEFVSDMILGTAYNPVEFNVIINSPPEVVSGIENQEVNEYFVSFSFDLDTVFSDPESNNLTYTVSLDVNDVVGAEINGSILTLTELGTGSASVNVVANDGYDSTSLLFDVNVIDINVSPVLTDALPDRDLNEGFTSFSIQLMDYFNDPDNDVLTFSVTNDNESVVTAEVDGTDLLITELAPGTAGITINVSDGEFAINDVFQIDVNGSPQIETPLEDIVLNSGFTTHNLSIDNVFSDPENDALTYSVSSTNEGVLTAGLDNLTLFINEISTGTATLGLTASDGNISVTDEFTVKVNSAPTVLTEIPDQSVDEGFDSLTFDLLSVFEDPDGDDLNFSGDISNTDAGTLVFRNDSLIINEAGTGQGEITVHANDGFQNAEFVFSININGSPVISTSISDLFYDAGFNSDTLNLMDYFLDPDDDPIFFSVSGTNAQLVEIQLEDSLLIMNETGVGSSILTITASDGSLSIEDIVNVSVDGSPVVSNPLEDLYFEAGFEVYVSDISETFTDPNGDALTYTVQSINEDVVTAELDGFDLSLNEVGSGMSIVVLTASDNLHTATDSFNVYINAAPLVNNPPGDIVVDEYFDTLRINLNEHFMDPEGGELSYTISGNDGLQVNTTIEESILIIAEVDTGTTSFTITASDAGTPQLNVDYELTITVNNINVPPVLISSLTDTAVNEYFDSLVIDLDTVFYDPDEEDILIYEAESYDENVFTVTVRNNILTIYETGIGAAIIGITVRDNGAPPMQLNVEFQLEVVDINVAPVILTPLENLVLDEFFDSVLVDLGTVFKDPDGDFITFEAVTDENDIISVSIRDTLLKISEVGLGSTNITVTASDTSLSTSATFKVTVNNVNEAPVLLNPGNNIYLVESFNSYELSLKQYYEDPDGDDLQYNATSLNSGVVTVSIVDDTIAYFEEMGTGKAIIVISASDSEFTVSDTIEIHITGENEFILSLDGNSIQSGDTIKVCNNADQFNVLIESDLNWTYAHTKNWLLLETEGESELVVAYGENLTDEDRFAEIVLTDVQGHTIHFILYQFSDCETSNVAITGQQEVKAYPNPFNDVIHIEGLGGSEQSVSLTLLDIGGKVIIEKHVTPVRGNTIILDVNGLEPGSYLLNISTASGRTVKTLIKL